MGPLFAVAALAALTVACGGNTPTSPSLPTLPGGFSATTLSRGTVRAVVDGTPWESANPTALVGSSFGGVPPLITLSAVSRTSNLFLSISGPAVEGTHVPSGQTYVSFSLLSDFTSRWSVSPFDTGTSGTLTITTATATRVAGTFSFTAAAQSPGLTPATRTVTNGTFDLSR